MQSYRKDHSKQYRTALRTLIASRPATTSSPLPLTHVTDCIRLPDILRSDCLEPRPCRVFGDNRLYAFYARPAYRSSKQGSLHNINFAPVCFLLDTSIIGDVFPVEIFPFDTGGLSEGLLAEYVHGDLSPFDFSLEPKIASAQKLASAFFGSEKNYFTVKPARKIQLKYSKLDAEIVAYESLVIRSTEDERSTSIEFQFKDKLAIAGKVLAAIIPQDFLDEPEICDAFLQKKIEPLPYAFMPDHSVKDLIGTFYKLAAAFYRREKRRHGWQW